ncbi:MAG: hypothetical protein ACFB3T_04700 [Geminicoccaceae bacterium]
MAYHADAERTYRNHADLDEHRLDPPKAAMLALVLSLGLWAVIIWTGMELYRWLV